MTDFSPRALRDAFGSFMTGVTVVTAHDANGNPIGFTANSFSSVSLDPPLLLVCVANTSRNIETLSKTEKFAVNILSETQKDISNTFARPVEDRFAAVDWRAGPHGSPVLGGVSAWFDCSVHNRVPAGDHLILIGRVEAFEHEARPGLGYAQGAYVTPAAQTEALNNSANLLVSVIFEHKDKILLTAPDAESLLLPETKVGKNGASAALARLMSGLGVNAEPGFVYSVYEDEDRETQHITFLCQVNEEGTGNGTYYELNDDNLAKLPDLATRTMLRRFAAESKMGNFGVYFGNKDRGKIRPITHGD